MNPSHEWLFTESAKQIFVKRGDPLGWGEIADNFSNMLVPGFSKGTYDARWITILCWCLYVSKNAPLTHSLNTRNGKRERYQWLKPLELIWIAHALKHNNDTKGMQLPGRRGVQRWVDMDKTNQSKDRKFGLSTDQWGRYRNSGIYAIYRVSLRKLYGLTKNSDGWVLDDVGIELAKWMENKLSEINPDEIEIKPRCKPETHWRKNVWNKLNNKSTIFPTSSSNIILPKREQKILKKALFCEGPDCVRRRIVVETIGKVEADTYSDLCSHIAKKLEKTYDGNDLALLAPFSQFSDSAIDVFIEIISIMRENAEGTKITIIKLVENKNVQDKIRSLVDESNVWIKKSANIGNNTKINFSLVNELAESISYKNKDEIGILRVLINYHIVYGGGRKWFNIIDSDYLELATSSRSNSKPNFYRFRLWQLARMAIQCGVIKQEDLPEFFKEADDEDILNKETEYDE